MAGRAPRPVAQRFWDKVEVTESCWLWSGGTFTQGYGRFDIGSRTDGTRRSVKAHRFAYEAVRGPVPDGLVIDHLCRVRNCVNPAHLEAVTSRINILRGVGVAPQNAAKTECPNGHPYEGPNLRVQPSGSRYCFACKRARRLAQAVRAG